MEPGCKSSWSIVSVRDTILSGVCVDTAGGSNVVEVSWLLREDVVAATSSWFI